MTPTTTRPPSKSRQHVAEGERAGHRVELVPAFDQPGGGRGVEIGAERHDHHVGVEGPGVGLDARATGSIARTVVCTNRTPGLTMSR